MGKATLVAAAILAFGAGAVARLSRRLRRLPPRVWIGHAPLHATRHIADATRCAGYPTRTVVTSTKISKYALVTSHDFDRVIGEPEVPWHARHWVALCDLLRYGDVWLAYFDSIFFPAEERFRNELTLRLLRLAGIRIVVVSHGSDVVQWSRQATRFDWVARMQSDYPGWDFHVQTKTSRERIRLFSRYADLVIAPYHAVRRLLPRCDLVFTPFSINPAEFPVPPAANNEVPVIVHAPNHRNVKGTFELIAAVDRLQARGIACELRLIEGVPRAEALKLYGASDIIADQFIIGAFGVFAVEAMALGRPVLTYLDQEMLGDPVFEFPLVNANPENLERVLEHLIRSPELRERLGRAGRAAVERYLTPQALAEVWAMLIEHVWRGRPLRLEQTAHFSTDRKPRAFTEDPDDPAFWP